MIHVMSIVCDTFYQFFNSNSNLIPVINLKNQTNQGFQVFLIRQMHDNYIRGRQLGFKLFKC